MLPIDPLYTMVIGRQKPYSPLDRSRFYTYCCVALPLFVVDVARGV